MSTLPFVLLCISIIVFGALIGLFLSIITNKKKKLIPISFCKSNKIYGKFTDQNEVSINTIIKDFKLLDI